MLLHGEIKIKHEGSIKIEGHEELKKLLEDYFSNINLKLDEMAATIDQVVQDVNDESTLDDSIITLLNGISQQLKDALSGATLPPDVQAKVDGVFIQLEANKQKISDAITANTQ